MVKKMQGKFTAEFKAQVALADISNQMTVSEIVEKYKVSKTMVYQWKDEFLSNASKVFESDRATRQQEKQYYKLLIHYFKLDCKLQSFPDMAKFIFVILSN